MILNRSKYFFAYVIIDLMRIKQTLLFSIFFALSIFVGALHHLEHTHSNSENCMVCHIQTHSDSPDITPTLAEVINLFHFQTLLQKQQTFYTTTFKTTLYGRAPPTFS
jgi:hypothetical protein